MPAAHSAGGKGVDKVTEWYGRLNQQSRGAIWLTVLVGLSLVGLEMVSVSDVESGFFRAVITTVQTYWPLGLMGSAILCLLTGRARNWRSLAWQNVTVLVVLVTALGAGDWLVANFEKHPAELIGVLCALCIMGIVLKRPPKTPVIEQHLATTQIKTPSCDIDQLRRTGLYVAGRLAAQVLAPIRPMQVMCWMDATDNCAITIQIIPALRAPQTKSELHFAMLECLAGPVIEYLTFGEESLLARRDLERFEGLARSYLSLGSPGYYYHQPANTLEAGHNVDQIKRLQRQLRWQLRTLFEANATLLATVANKVAQGTTTPEYWQSILEAVVIPDVLSGKAASPRDTPGPAAGV